MVILDTNIIIDHLRKKTDSALMLISSQLSREELAISMLSIQELYEGRSTRILAKEKDLLAVISPLKIFPYTYEIAQLAGQIARDLPQSIELADSAIAATCLIHQAQLFTLNKQHFSPIKGLKLWEPKK